MASETKSAAATDRQQALDSIKVGDVICGVSGSGREKLLLVYEASERTFLARHVTSQTSAEFGRDGEALPVPEGGTCTIISTAELPPHDYQVAIGLDRKAHTAKELSDLRLTSDELQLLRTYRDFFRRHPLPPARE